MDLRRGRAALALTMLVCFGACTMDARRRPTVAVPTFVPPSPTPSPTPAPAPAEEPPQAEAESAPRIVRRTERREAVPSTSPERKRAIEPQATPRARKSTSLQAIAAERARVLDADAYRLGAGDIVSIRVFGLDEMKRKSRVSRRGDVQLPLIGSIRAAGRTEAELAREIASRLEREYLQDAQVDVFVDEYRSQQVAVTGAVSKPGLISLTRDRYTVLEAISEAGGLTKDAGAVVEFIPARKGRRSRAFDLVRSSVDSVDRLSGQAIQIPITDLMRGTDQTAVRFPIVAGDVIHVPEAGSFSLEGWVVKTGTYPLTRGMTILGALSAGAGPMFPAALGSVELLRGGTGSSNAREILEVDVNAIQEGAAADVVLQAGDVVRVPANPFFVPPWVLYRLLQDLIRLGASIPIV